MSREASSLPKPDVASVHMHHRQMLQFLGLNALAGLSVGVAKVTLSLYAIALQADAVLLGLIAGAQSVGLLLMSVPAGVLVDRYGPLRLFSIGTLCSGALYLSMPWVNSASLLCLVMLLISCFMPLRIVSLTAMFMQQIGRVGVGMAGWFRATHMLGMLLLGPLVAAWLLEGVGFGGSYIAIGGTFLLLVMLAPTVLRHYHAEAEHVRRLDFAEVKGLFALIGRDGAVRRACLREFAIQAANQYYTFFIIVIAVQTFGFEPASAAGLISAQGMSFVISLLLLGGLAARISVSWFLGAGYAAVAGALVVLGAAHRAELLWLGGIGLGVGLGMLQIVNISSFARIGARYGQGRIAGLTTFIGPAGGLTGSLIGGVSGNWVGLQAIFLCLSAVFCLFMATGLRSSGPRPVE